MLVYVLRLQRRLLVQPPLRAPRTYPLRPRPWRQRSVSAVHAVERLLTLLVRRDKGGDDTLYSAVPEPVSGWYRNVARQDY